MRDVAAEIAKTVAPPAVPSIAPPPATGPAPATAPSRSPASEAPSWLRDYQNGAQAARQGDLKSAIERFNEAARYAPRESAPLTALAAANLKMAEASPPEDRGKFMDSAVAAANKAASLDNHSPDIAFLQGLAFQRSGRLDSAEQALRRATELDPSSSLYFYALGVVLNQENKSVQAEKALRQSVQLDPNASDARLLLASILATRNKTAARKQIEILKNDGAISGQKSSSVERLQNLLNEQPGGKN
jgi:Flp pilus assembly protein TadD